jgi:hypothetical protein
MEPESQEIMETLCRQSGWVMKYGIVERIQMGGSGE